MADDTLLTYGAIGIESLVVVALVILCIRSVKLRKHAIVVLGAIAPMIVFYVGAWIEFTRNPTDPSARFAYLAMWIMGIGFFVVSAFAGSLISLSPRPSSQWVRFLMGVLVGSFLFFAATRL